MTDFKYVGAELDLFAAVRNWKAYWSRQLQPYISGDVLEVGAGIGSNTSFLDRGGDRSWTCLEPDPHLIAQLNENLAEAGKHRSYKAICGTLERLGPDERFDTIIYIDVLEHIEDDRRELENAASRIREGGRIVVLSPAHQKLFTPFDAEIGHFRRYNRTTLKSISPPGLRLERMFYLDSAGLLLSIANLLLLRQSMPTKAQLSIWDNCVIPVSRILDRFLLHSVGKTIVGIWRRDTA